ncbi:MAG: hypothetical protein KAJ06_10395, partial [Gammaproteobacteria bacterium]|nr:hypothetical protein [Gammaproteobacteria bacterium]
MWHFRTLLTHINSYSQHRYIIIELHNVAYFTMNNKNNNHPGSGAAVAVRGLSAQQAAARLAEAGPNV